jgi:hypothetical protein
MSFLQRQIAENPRRFPLEICRPDQPMKVGCCVLCNLVKNIREFCLRFPVPERLGLRRIHHHTHVLSKGRGIWSSATSCPSNFPVRRRLNCSSKNVFLVPPVKLKIRAEAALQNANWFCSTGTRSHGWSASWG